VRARRDHSGERAVVSLLRPHGMLPLVAALPACWFLFIALRRIRPRRSVSPTSDTSSASSNVTVIAISPPWSLQVSTRALDNVPTRLRFSSFSLAARRRQAHDQLAKEEEEVVVQAGFVTTPEWSSSVLVDLIVAQGVLVPAALEALRTAFDGIATLGRYVPAAVLSDAARR
jgi:hypothetical protein